MNPPGDNNPFLPQHNAKNTRVLQKLTNMTKNIFEYNLYIYSFILSNYNTKNDTSKTDAKRYELCGI